MSAYTADLSRSQKKEFETHGFFRCAYSTEKFYMILIICVCFACMSAVSAFMVSWMTDSSQALFIALAILVCDVILAAVAIVLLRLVLYGREYSYSADESKMTICGEAKRMDIYYSNVISVQYEELMLFRLKRGFRVTIITKKSQIVFNMIYRRFDARMTPDSTPFRILEEHAGLLNIMSVDEAVQLRRSQMTEQQLAYEDGLLERPIVRSERPQIVINQPKISYVDSEESLIIAKGKFFTPHPKRLLFSGIILLISEAWMFFHAFMFEKTGEFEFIIIGAVIIPFAIGAYRIASRKEYSYVADGREFRITSKGCSETLYYCDMVEVKYKLLKLLWREYGYRVSIVTKYRTITYDCLFLANKKYQETKELPFHILEEHIPK